MDQTVEQLRHAPRMQIHFNVHEPVELVEMTLAFQALGFEYQSFLKARAAATEGARTADVKLYVTRIESNCILAELAPALPLLGQLMPVLTNVNTVADFVTHTATLIRRVMEIGLGISKGDVDPASIGASRRSLQHVLDITRLVAKNKDANLGLRAIRYEDGADRTLLEVDFSDADCSAAARGARIAMDALETRERADAEKVLMYFWQANLDDPKSSGRTGDKAVISSVSPDPLRVYVIPQLEQEKVRHVLDDPTHNPLRTGFVVDVNVEKDPRGRPRVYRVVRIHEVIHDESEGAL